MNDSMNGKVTVTTTEQPTELEKTVESMGRGRYKMKDERIPIDEDMHLENEWYEKARYVTVDTLKEYCDHIMNDYKHDYGTYCHAVTACAIATAYAYGRDLTAFQANIIALLFPRHWFYSNIETYISIRDWDNFLYPQYEQKFDKTISKGNFEVFVEAATKHLESVGVTIDDDISDDAEYRRAADNCNVHPAVVRHWQSIARGIPPFGYKIVDHD